MSRCTRFRLASPGALSLLPSLTVEHVITSPSTACPTRIAVVTLMQFSPWMRDVAKDFMDKHAARETNVDTVALMPPARL